MRCLCLPLLLLSTLPAFAEEVTGKVTVTGKTVSLEVGSATTPLAGDLAAELSLLAGETVTLQVARTSKALTVESIRAPERTEITAVAEQKAGKWVLVTKDKQTLDYSGRTALVSSKALRTYDVWRIPAAQPGARARVVVVAYEAETTKSWLILLEKPELSLPTGWIRGRGRSVWVLEEQPGFVRIRHGDSVGWLQSNLTAALEQPKQGLVKALEGAGGE